MLKLKTGFFCYILILFHLHAKRSTRKAFSEESLISLALRTRTVLFVLPET